MIRIQADGELFDVNAAEFFAAAKMVRVIRPNAVVISDTTGGRHELRDDADTNLYTGDKVAHWSHPGETGEVVDTEIPRLTGRVSHVEWPGGGDVTSYMAADLIRVTAAN
jgi:hypothetical protein